MNPIVEGFHKGFLFRLCSQDLFECVPDDIWMRFGNIVKKFFAPFGGVLFKRFEGVSVLVLLICLHNVENNNILLWG